MAIDEIAILMKLEFKMFKNRYSEYKVTLVFLVNAHTE